MTDDLKDFLTTRAASADPPPLDLTAITTTGTRRLRRRRFSTYAGTAVLTAGAVVAGLGVAARTVDRSDPDPAAPVALPFAEKRPTYAKKDLIHYGTETFSIGKGELVSQFVQTDAGFVFTSMVKGDGELDGKPAPDGTDQRRAYVTLIDRSGSHRIGGQAWSRGPTGLVTGHRGSLVGWTESIPGKPPLFGTTVVYDTATRRELLRVPQDAPIPGVPGSPAVGRLIAIDAGYAYFSTKGGLYRLEPASRKGQTIPLPASGRLPGPTTSIGVIGSGKALFLKTEGDRTHAAWIAPLDNPSAGQRLTPTPQLRGTREAMRLSPDGRHLIVTVPNPGVGESFVKVYAAESGREIELRADGYEALRFGQWLDDETFTAAGIGGATKPSDLLSCSVRTRGCQVLERAFARQPAHDRAELRDPDKLAFPVGHRVF